VIGGAGPSGRIREVQGGFAQLCRGSGESCDILQALEGPGIDREAKGDMSELGAAMGTPTDGWDLKRVIVRS
jgi:hypothetical protein